MDIQALVPRREDIFAIAIVLVAYFVTGRLGIELYAVNGFATFVWPPTGIAIAALILAGKRAWLGIFLGAFAVNITAGASFSVAFLIGIGNTLEAALAVYILMRYVGFDATLGRLRDAVGLILAAALAAPVVAASIGTMALVASGTIVGDVSDTWIAWYVGDMLGALVIAPLILAWFAAHNDAKERPGFAELTGLMFALLAANFTSFYSSSIAFDSIPLIYLVVLPLIWAALRFGVRGVTFSLFITASIAIMATIQGSGPFAAPTVVDSLLGVQFFVACITVVFLLLASVSAERRRALDELHKYIENLESSLQEMRFVEEKQRVRRQK